jgi:XTP/dITP diphosphohydrolase
MLDPEHVRTKRKLVLASRNLHKVQELGELLAPHELAPLPDAVELPPEDGETFADNALIKAQAVAKAVGGPVIADDSGIESAALGGAPGVRSARYAGENATDGENLAKLLAEAPAGSALAYVCVLVYIDDEGAEHLFEGRCTGVLAAEPSGTGGFGYDPAFIPDDYDDTRTMAQLSAVEKHAISHRGRAARPLLEYLNR